MLKSLYNNGKKEKEGNISALVEALSERSTAHARLQKAFCS